MIRWVCTSNPFYVVSAGLFLVGLWVSFAEQPEAPEEEPQAVEPAEEEAEKAEA